jgi:cobaltochelatase CobT
MSERVLVLRDAVVKITQMLSGKGIKVTQRGVNAYVKSDQHGRPMVVNLPYLPDNASEELCHAIQGFLDHEVAHILFTEFPLLKEAMKFGCMPMLNILEDARIEKAMALRYGGSGHNLAVTGKFFLDKYTTPMMNEAMTSKDQNKLIAVLAVPLIRAMAGQSVFKEFMRDKMPLVQPIYDKIADLESKIEAAASTQDCLDLAKEIQDRLSDKKPPGPPSKEKSEEEGEGEGKGASAKFKSKSKPKSKSDDKGEEGEGDTAPAPADEEEAAASTPTEGGGDAASTPTEGAPKPKAPPAEEEEPAPAPGEEEEEPAPAPGDEDEEEEPAPADPTPAADEEEDEESGGSSSGVADDSAADGADSESTTGSTVVFMNEIDKENANSFSEKMSTVISNESVEAASTAPYLVFTRDDDVIEPLKVGSNYRPEMFTEMASKVDHMVGPLQKDLERAIAARSMSSWEAGKRSGRMHSANLSRLACGDDRVFRRKHESTSKDVAVSLVVDCSGSMAGSKVHLAAQSAYALSAVLERIGIKHEVVCFTTGYIKSHHEFEVEEVKLGRGFSRVEPLYMPILKGFNERLTADVKARFGWLPNSSILRNNVDGECVEIAARRLSQRREAGKVILVLSDGAPNAHGSGGGLQSHLKETVAAITKRGTKIVGIGIQSSEVTKFYPKNLVINEVSELPERVVKELRHMLVQ